MAYLIGSADITRFNSTVSFNAGIAGGGNQTVHLVGRNDDPANAVATGTATQLSLYISSWGTCPSINVSLYDEGNAGALLNSVVIPASVGTGLVTVTFPATVITSGRLYRLGIYTEDDRPITFFSDTAGLTLRNSTSGTYASPVDPAPLGNWVSNDEVYWALQTAATDTTAPVLSNPSVTPAWKSATTAFDTDTGEGTASAIYYLASEATDPTKEEVDGNSYAATVAHVSVAVSAAGTVTLPDPAGLTPNTEYKVKIVHTDAAGNIGELAPVSFTTLSATATFAITGAVNETDWTVILFDGAVSDNPNKLKAVGTTGPDASGNLVINLDDVNVSDGQTIEGIAVDASIDKPAPLRGNVSIA